MLATPAGDADRAPARGRKSFYCPYCGAFANHTWREIYVRSTNGFTPLDSWTSTACAACHAVAMWRGDSMVYPLVRRGPMPHQEMPENVLALYEEARDVSGRSPKSAAALLRLALQMLVDDLVPGGDNINAKIGVLVKQGLDPRVQQAMDVLRVIGNNAVHPGQIDVGGSEELVGSLFSLLNLVVEEVIARPNQVASLFNSLPQGAQEAIKKRDGV